MFLKKQPISDQTLNRIIKYLAIVLLVLAILFMAIQFKDLWNWITAAIKSAIVPVSLAYLIALIIFPLVKYLEKKGIGPRGLSLAIVFVLSAALIFASFYFITPLVISEINNFFSNDFPRIITYITVDMRDSFIFGSDIYDRIMTYIEDTNIIGEWLNNLLPSFLASIGSVAIPLVTTIALLPILLIYYLLDYEVINERLRSIIPAKHEKNAAELGSRLNQTVGAYLRGQLLLMLAIGSVATIVYKLIGLKYFFVFGLIVGVTNIIPYFGTIIAAVPPIVYAFISAPVGPGPLLVLLVNVVIQFIEGNIFQPIIMGHQLEIHPIIIIISILFFGSLFGTLGVVFASPIAASIRVIWNFFKELKARKLAQSEEGATISP